MTGRFYFIFFRTHYVETRERESLEYSAAAEGKWPNDTSLLRLKFIFLKLLRWIHYDSYMF